MWQRRQGDTAEVKAGMNYPRHWEALNHDNVNKDYCLSNTPS